ncbi:hypothetical protein [Streptomyces sp. N35]|uniref:hypothetical protein n=1 Tax=Streptomyces sp. N35 TaxID=2795730 RepID=UPI0018F75712|nr:hypothetical protein [Streptomyces sp. N35]
MTTRPFTASRCPIRGLRFVPPVTVEQISTDDVDWYAVERVVRDDWPLPELNLDELREAALILRRNDVERAAVSARLCIYERLVKEWEADAGMLSPDQLCTENGCGKARAGRGLCTNHLSIDRLRRKKAATEAVAA